MRRPPPRLVRRLVLAPFVVVMSLLLIALSPIVMGGAVVLDVVHRSAWRLSRIMLFAVVYLVHEADFRRFGPVAEKSNSRVVATIASPPDVHVGCGQRGAPAQGWRGLHA